MKWTPSPNPKAISSRRSKVDIPIQVLEDCPTHPRLPSVVHWRNSTRNASRGWGSRGRWRHWMAYGNNGNDIYHKCKVWLEIWNQDHVPAWRQHRPGKTHHHTTTPPSLPLSFIYSCNLHSPKKARHLPILSSFWRKVDTMCFIDSTTISSVSEPWVSTICATHRGIVCAPSRLCEGSAGAAGGGINNPPPFINLTGHC